MSKFLCCDMYGNIVKTGVEITVIKTLSNGWCMTEPKESTAFLNNLGYCVWDEKRKIADFGNNKEYAELFLELIQND